MKILMLLQKFIRRERGSFLVLAAITMLVVLGLAALAIDVGYMLTARNQLQAGVDASALAGAAGLMTNQNLAIQRAMDFAGRNICIQQPVAVSAADISFPTANRIRVTSSRQLPLFFASALGLNQTLITASATAELGSIVGTDHLRPWAIPDFGFRLGDYVVIKSGELGAPGTNPGFFYPVDFPPANKGTPETGASAYSSNIENGCDGTVEIGDILQVEPGNMVGPTKQGVDAIIRWDSGAYWSTSTNSIMGSRYPGYSSPRICIVPLYDERYPPDSGRNTVTVTGLAVFFVEGISGKNVYGRFIEMLTHGIWGSGNTYLYGVHLVE
jgi:hypothetical protein